MRKFITRTVAALTATAAAFTPLVAKTPAPAKPAMWVLSDADTTIYLFGTIHLLPKGTQWRTPTFDKAATSASDLVVETVIDEANPMAAAQEMMKMAVSPNLPPLAERVAPEKRAKLAEVAAKTGVPTAVFDQLETWGAAFIMLSVTMQELGLDPKSGVESALKAEFTTAKKPIGQLETNAEQFGFFDTLPEKAQREFLESVLDNPAKAKKQFDEMLSVWTSGDVKAMGETFNREFAKSPELRENLLRKRNANWNGWLQRRLATPGTTLVAVGAGHLSGDDSVIAMLEKGGYKVKRVQ
ncbi:MAG: TraB/GumN family protein [Pseudomonadota bacterium]